MSFSLENQLRDWSAFPIRFREIVLRICVSERLSAKRVREDNFLVTALLLNN